MTVREYISLSWKKSLRSRGHRKDGIPLPYPYNSPCASGLFDEFYYWDTCFINKGLLADGKWEQALYNVRNIAYLIEKYGYMPNAAVEGMLDRSQPPLFAMMCDDIVRGTGTDNGKLAAELFPALEKEYSFWMQNRILPCGLNRYGNQADRQTKLHMASEREQRLKISFPAEYDREKLGDDTLAECESGWDFSPRFAHQCTEYAPVDLNSILYGYEKTLSHFAPDGKKRAEYMTCAEARKERMFRFCRNQNGYRDGIPAKKAFGNVLSVACFTPFLFEMDKDKKFPEELLKKLECENGISACEKMETAESYQWGYPNMWAPLIWFSYEGLKRAGLLEEVQRIGKKYLRVVENGFAESGKLWEKYDAVTGQKASVNEYAETEMLGWTAGVYSVIYDELVKGEKI